MNKKTLEKESEQEVFELSVTAQEERDVLAFWKENDIFQKSIEQREGNKEYIFYDGPPFGTGLPHYGHTVPGTIKDVIPRYKTMKGFKVDRKWGWDCHGLPIENMIEKEVGLNSKKEIEEYGIDTFNQKCKDSVLKYEDDWKQIIPQTGRFVDMNTPYKTMDSNYTESLWWAFDQLDKKGLVSKDFKPMHICPRCETTLSNNEVTEGYTDIKDLSVTAKFELVDEPGTFVLAWTTTPWTLPGNVALAVGEDIDYLKVKNQENEEMYIVAKELREKTQQQAGMTLEIVGELKGVELVGKAYQPLFDYYASKESLENKENGWKIYAAEFVTTDAGTGIVHIAPAFGEDDLKLGKKNNLPWVQHVKMNGAFRDEVVDFAGMLVRKKEFHDESDIEIIKHLAKERKLFFKEKYEHSYPHCWRCKTPLLNYATSSWFINSPKIKDQIVAENKRVSWVPKYIGEKRFHNWLEETRDWAVSRSRYWGAPVPVWENKESGEYRVLGSLQELKERTRSSNSYTFIRHGQSESNVKHLLSSVIGQSGDSLTFEGKKQAKNAAAQLTDIDVIISSPFKRTLETAEIIRQELGLSEDVIIEERMRETSFGEKSGSTTDIFREFIGSDHYSFKKKFYDGESAFDVGKRVMEFFYETDEKYKGKNILVVGHGASVMAAKLGRDGLNEDDARMYASSCDEVKNAVPYELDFSPIPHNQDYELDYHRPYIDQISFEEDGKKFEFIKEVFDCWFESGSMPYASKHYPFENSDIFNPEKGIGFPADFISEGQDQTRGWFNSMLILSTALFGQSPYKNVVVHGMLMAEDGKKMSKSEKNYPPMEKVLNKYGADSLRMFLMSSSIVKGDSPAFSEKGVDEIMKKLVMKTKNILSFYELYKDAVTDHKKPSDSKNILDKWILEKTKILVRDVEKGLESYALDEATKPFLDFVDDFSTWFIRRSRDRFKGEDEQDRDYAIATTKEVLRKFSKTVAPFAPFLAEYVWNRVREESEKESVHLELWPETKESFLSGKIIKNDVIETMESVREIVSIGLEARTRSSLKVRQPLQSALVVGVAQKVDQKYSDIIKDELNIKEIFFAENKESALSVNGEEFIEALESITEEDKNIYVVLDTKISEELQREGDYREFLRQIQIMRKNKGLQVQDAIELKIDLMSADSSFIEEFRGDLEKTAGVKNINYSDVSGEEMIRINDKEIKVVLLEI